MPNEVKLHQSVELRIETEVELVNYGKIL